MDMALAVRRWCDLSKTSRGRDSPWPAKVSRALKLFDYMQTFFFPGKKILTVSLKEGDWQ